MSCGDIYDRCRCFCHSVTLVDSPPHVGGEENLFWEVSRCWLPQAKKGKELFQKSRPSFNAHKRFFFFFHSLCTPFTPQIWALSSSRPTSAVPGVPGLTSPPQHEDLSSGWGVISIFSDSCTSLIPEMWLHELIVSSYKLEFHSYPPENCFTFNFHLLPLHLQALYEAMQYPLLH